MNPDMPRTESSLNKMRTGQTGLKDAPLGVNPTFPNNSSEEIINLFYAAFREKTKEACFSTTPKKTISIFSVPLKFSLFDYLGIDEVNY